MWSWIRAALGITDDASHLGLEKRLIRVKKQKGAATSFISRMRVSEPSWSSPRRISLFALRASRGDAGVSPLQTSPERCTGCRGILVVPLKRSPSPTCCVMETKAQRVTTCGVGRGCCSRTRSCVPQSRGVDDWIGEQLSPEETDNFKRFWGFFPFKKK